LSNGPLAYLQRQLQSHSQSVIPAFSTPLCLLWNSTGRQPSFWQ